MTEMGIVVQEEKALQAFLDQHQLGVAGEENLRQGDLAMPPRLQISQQNRPIEFGDVQVDPGSIVNSLTGQVYPNGVNIVPLVFLPRTRVMWPQTFSTSNDPMCVSDDGDKPLGPDSGRVMTNPQQGPCAECQYSRFNDDGTPPPCKLQRNFLVMVVEDDAMEPAILTMQSTALASAKQLTSLAKTQGVAKTIRFVAQEMRGDSGQWYVPAFAKGRKLELSELVAIVESRDDLKNLVVTADLDAHSTNGFNTDVAGEEEQFDAESIPF